jgi:hypothetical protein
VKSPARKISSPHGHTSNNTSKRGGPLSEEERAAAFATPNACVLPLSRGSGRLPRLAQARKRGRRDKQSAPTPARLCTSTRGRSSPLASTCVGAALGLGGARGLRGLRRGVGGRGGSGCFPALWSALICASTRQPVPGAESRWTRA